MIYGMEQIQKLESYVAKYPAIDQLLVSLEQKTKVKKIYLLYGKYWVYIGSFSRQLMESSKLQALSLQSSHG